MTDNIIFFIHVIIIIAALLVPFFGDNQLLEMYSLFVPFIFFHWTVNDDTCALTKLEEFLTNEPKERTFMGRLVGPIYNVSDDDLGKFIKFVAFSLWLFVQFRTGHIRNTMFTR
jgi:hypothetical protein